MKASKENEKNHRPVAWPVWGLFFCAAALLVTLLFAFLRNGIPALRELGGQIPPAEDIILQDPAGGGTVLTAGLTEERPVALVQAGTQPLLLRVRIEETLLRLRREILPTVPGVAGPTEPRLILAVTSRLERFPGGMFVPRTVKGDGVLALLKEKGFLPGGAEWADALRLLVPPERLPANSGGNLMVFEHSTVETNTADTSAGGTKTTFAYLGFYHIVEANGDSFYQLLELTIDETPTQLPAPQPPLIRAVAYQFYEWVTDSTAVWDVGASGGEIQLRAPNLQPLSSWKQPSAGWYYDSDGWIYYGKVLEPGEITPLLLEGISVAASGQTDSVADGETQLRLNFRYQGAPLDQEKIKSIWFSGQSLDGLGTSTMSDLSGALARQILAAASEQANKKSEN
ncbi:MAG: hypothetical protein LBJ11_09390 [Oscillospiraceae bacterium]|nr:hypothetical protein [Oscillospiraceae bacterium]